jgi:protein SCO1/2
MLLPSLLASLMLIAPAQPPGPATPDLKVGLEEKLGATIPLDQPLLDEEGAPVTLAQLVDKPTLLTLNYFRCAGVCTPQLQGMVEVLNRTRAEPGKAFQVVTVSFDPRDTPAIARQKRINHLQRIGRPMPAQAWRFLTGPPEATRALADAVGFRFRRQKEDFIHPAVVIVLSPGGKVTRYLHGLTYLPAEVEQAVDEAARGEARPSVARLMSMCYSYDPEGRRYVFSFTRLAGTLIVAAAAALLLVMLVKGWSGGRSGGRA